MQSFFGTTIQPPKFGWQTEPHPTDEGGTHPEVMQQDDHILPDDLNLDTFDGFVPDLPAQEQESGQTRSGPSGFGPAFTPLSYSNDNRLDLGESPEQGRRQSQILPVSLFRPFTSS